MIDWRKVLIEYMRLVCCNEGTTFLHSDRDVQNFAEITGLNTEAIRNLVKEACE